MSKIFTIAIFCLSICLLSALLTLHYFIEDYKSLSNPNLNNYSDGQSLEDYRYNKLKTFSSYPILGYFYSESLIKEMVKRKLWEEAIIQSTLALQSIVNSRSYTIWYFKAVAECAQFKFQQCQKSLYEAQFFAPKFFQNKINKLKSIFNYKYKKNMEVRRHEIQIL